MVQPARPPPSADRCGDSSSSSTAWPTSRRWARRNPTTISWPGGWSSSRRRDLKHVFFSDDGATAVEVGAEDGVSILAAAPRSAAARRRRYVAWADAYHGDTLGSVSVGGVERFHAMFEPLLFEVLRLPAPGHVSPAGGRDARDGAARTILAQVERLLAAEHERIAAVVIEPLVQGAAGMIMHPPAICAACAS